MRATPGVRFFYSKIEFHVPGARGDCDDVVSIAPWVENWDSIARNGDFGMKFVTVSRGTALFGFNGGLWGYLGVMGF